MAETAAEAAPGRPVTGLRDIRVLKGVTVDDGREVVLTATATAAPRAAGDGLDMVIAGDGGPRPHYRARAVFGDGIPSGTPAALPDLRPFPMTVPDAYRDLLFHGPLFQHIVAIGGMDARGATARLRCSRPERYLTGAAGRPWLLDPVLLDSALQVQVLWARLEWDATLLPAQIGGYARVDAPAQDEIVSHELRIRDQSAAPMCHADHWFFGSDGRLIATLSDVVGVGSAALNRLSAVAS
jgi:hypothetical protein